MDWGIETCRAKISEPQAWMIMFERLGNPRPTFGLFGGL